MKKYNFILYFILSGCSLLAQPIENGQQLPNIDIWRGYYQIQGKDRFDLFRSCIKIDNQYIYEKILTIGIESGIAEVDSSFVYSIIDKTVIYQHTNTSKKIDHGKKTKFNTNTITNRLQVLLQNSLDAKDTSLRVLDLMNVDVTAIEFTNTAGFLKPAVWVIVKTNTNYSTYKIRPPRILTSTDTPQDIASAIPWELATLSSTIPDHPSYPPITIAPDTDTRPFLVKMTDDKPMERYFLTSVAVTASEGMLGLVGMGVGSELEIFKECVKNEDGTPLIVQGQKVFGYAYGKEKYPLFYTPIDDPGKNRYGTYWFNGTDGLGKFQLPVYIWDGRIFSGYLKMFDQPIRHPQDYGFLGDRENFPIDGLFRRHLIAITEEK